MATAGPVVVPRAPPCGPSPDRPSHLTIGGYSHLIGLYNGVRAHGELSDEIEVNRNQGYIVYMVLQIDHGGLEKKYSHKKISRQVHWRASHRKISGWGGSAGYM